MIDTAFQQPDEQAVADRFVNDGFVTAPADDRVGLDRIQRRAAELAAVASADLFPAGALDHRDHRRQ